MSSTATIGAIEKFQAPPVRMSCFSESPSAAIARKTQALQSLSLFDGVSDADLSRLAENVGLRRFERGRPLMRKESRQDCALLVEGRAKSSISRGTGELVLGIFERGDILSEDCWVQKVAAPAAETVALETCIVLTIPRRCLELFLLQRGTVAMRFIEAMASRIHRMMDLATQNSCLEVSDRLYRKLMQFSGQRVRSLPDGSLRIEHGLYQSELAACVGASRETVNRQLAIWRDQGLVVLGRRYIIIKDPLAFSQAATASGDREAPH